MPEERRVVSILFASVDGLDRLTAGLSPEEARDTADALFTRLRRVVEARGGFVDKIVGDTVMALFGAPVAHEDDPARAVRAALGLRAEVDLFAARREATLALRSGINLGEVLWGSVGGDRATVMGDVVNVAQRLGESCPPGAVLASRPVLRACGPRFRAGPEQEITVRNRHEPVAAAIVEGEAQARADVAGPAAALTGRDEELARLDARCGAGGFVLIEADSGIGKSRLALEVRRRVEGRGGTWVGVGHALEGARIPLAPFAEIVRTAARQQRPPGTPETEATGAWLGHVLASSVATEGERRALAGMMVRSMGHTEGDTGRIGGAAPRGSRDMQDAWLRWALALAARGPALLVVEDVHWADPGTLALLDALPGRVAGRNFTVLATSRPPAAGAPLPLRNFERLRLSELPADACRVIARDLLGRPLDDELADFLAERSGGNPLFLEELTTWLVEEGYVAGDPVAFTRRPHTLPDGLRGLLVARIDAVTPAAREALKAGSVFGRTFWVGETTRLLGSDAEPGVLQAERADLVVRHEASLLPDDTEVAFRQAPFRDAAYSLLTRKERQRLHTLAAAALEARAPQLGRRVVILAAHHRESAAQPAEAAALWLRAAGNAYAQSAFEEALGHARESQRIASSPGSTLVAVRALGALGLYELAQVEAQELADTEAAPEADRLVAKFELAVIHERQGRFRESLAVLDELAAHPRNSHLRVRLLRERTACCIRLTRYADAADAADQLESLAADAEAGGNRTQALEILSTVWTTRARIHYQQERFEECLAAYRRKQAVDAELGSMIGEAVARNGVGMVLGSMGRKQEARAEYVAALARFRESGDRWHTAMVLTNLSILEVEEGNVEEGFRLAREGLGIREEMGDRWGASLFLSNMGSWHATAGRFVESLDLLERALAIRRETADRAGVARILLSLSHTLFVMGRFERVVEVLDEALPTMREAGQRTNERSARARRAQALLEMGRRDEALAEFEDLIRSEPGRRERETGPLVRLRLAWAVDTTDLPRATALAGQVEAEDPAGAAGALACGTLALYHARAGRPAEARQKLQLLRDRLGRSLDADTRFEAAFLEARILAALGDAGAREVAAQGEESARLAGAEMWRVKFGALAGR